MIRQLSSALLGLLILAVSARAAATDFFLINPASEPLALPATVSSATAGSPKDGSHILPGGEATADVFEGRVRVLAPVGAMSSVKLATDFKQAPADRLLRVTEQPEAVEVETPAARFRAGADFLEIGAKEKSIRIGIGAFKPAILFKGANVVVLGDKERRIEIFRSGFSRLTGFKSVQFPPGDGVTLVQARKTELGVAKPANAQGLVFPEDWLRVAWTPKVFGTAVLPAYGTAIKGKDGAVTIEGPAPEVWLAPASSDREAWAARAQTQPAIIASADGPDRFKASVEVGAKTVALVILDRNKNAQPDAAGDLWLWEQNGKPALALAFSSAADFPRRLAIFKTGAVDLAKTFLNERPDDASVAVPEGLAPLKPEIIIEDWNKDGIFLNGGLVFGGFIGADRFSKDGVKWSQAWDLNGDRFCDVFEDSPGHYLFNFKGEMVSQFGIEMDPLAASAAIRIIRGYDIQKICSMFSKSCDPAGRMFKGAVQAFEEHFFADISPQENPAVWKNGAAFFYYLIGGGDVNRLTMGRLDGSAALRDWDIELDPVPEPNDPAEWTVATLKDASGHELKVHSVSIPEDWKGEKAGPRQFYKGWYDVAEGRIKTRALYACFSPPAAVCPSSEGMYGGSLTTQERIEVDEKGGTFSLYYSPLMGALHLKGADFGAYAIPAGTPDFFLDINRYYHREAHTGEERFVGAQPTVTWRQREAKRLIGPVFLGYSDEDGDGFFDRYIYDMDNDGIYERILGYDAKAGVVTLTDRNATAVWPREIKFEEIKYLPENYDAVSALYKKGTGQPPLVVSTSIGSSGTPVNIVTSPVFKEESPPFFATCGKEWQTVVATDLYHGGKIDPWLDFGPSGTSRIGSMFAKRNVTQRTLDAPWSDESLAGTDILLLPTLGLTPSEDEVAALKRWIERGGVCILSTTEDKAAWTRFAAIGKLLGFEPAAEILDKRAPVHMWKGLGGIGPQAKASEMRTPAPWNEVKHFDDPSKAGLLEGFEYLSFSGYPLAKLDGALKPLLGYDGQPLVAVAEIGKGRLLVSGVDLWTNRYIWHHEFFEGGTRNDQLVDRMVGLLVAPLPVLKVSAVDCSPEKISIKLAGKGGALKFSRRYDALSTDLAHIGNRTDLAKKKFKLAGASVNGTPVTIREVGTLEEVQLPPGESVLEITYAEIKP